jgi:uncharacterized protein
MDIKTKVIEETKKWITGVVIGCNFCPFASREVKRNSIHYQVETSTDLTICLQVFLQECIRLDNEEFVETTLLIFPNACKSFDGYLGLLALAEKIIKKNDYEGIYQVASFHPLYRFAGTQENDPANYTNRSIYPMLHLLREDKIEKALQQYPDPEQIPQRNIQFAREKGIAYMQILRNSCLINNEDAGTY